MAVNIHHERIADLLSWDRRAISLVIEQMTEGADNHWFFNQYSAQSTPDLIDETSIDMVTLYDLDGLAAPLPYKGCCEPNTVLTPAGDFAMMQSYTPPSLGSTFRVTPCDPMNDTRMLAELRGMIVGGTVNIRRMSVRDRINAYIQGMLAIQSSRTLETEVRQFIQALLYGKSMMGGPTVKPEDALVDFKRDAALTAVLPVANSWSQEGQNPMAANSAMMNMVYQKSGVQARTTAVFHSPESWDYILNHPQWQNYKCFCSDNNSGPVSQRFSMDITAENPAPRGLRELSYRPGDFGERHFLYDAEHVVPTPSVDNAGNPIIKLERKPILPPGSMFYVAEQDLEPLSLYGRIEFLGTDINNGTNGLPADSVFEARRRFVNRWPSPDGTCLNFDMLTRPLHTIRRPNATGLLFPIPDVCPPPEFLCATELTCGGLKAA